MPIHDWTRVGAGIFHDFHHGWIADLSPALKRGLLPSDQYALITAPPHVQFQQGPEAELYAAKVKTVVVHQVKHHRIVAILEILSPGNKNTPACLRARAEKTADTLRGGIHLLIADLHPPEVPVVHNAAKGQKW